ncbi:MAG: polyprenyl synthetase family protein [Prevotella sp.]|nr:polyprenyl synthetase family protein [Prevotella sp.]
MDYLSRIRKPIEANLGDFIGLFNESLTHSDGLLSQALAHIRRRTGKQMRPMLILLMAKNYGCVTDVTQNAAVGLELLHTASLVHDDVVDDSSERRGQASVNATYGNKVAVLVGDYLLSTALLRVAFTRNITIVEYLSELGRTLASGEILQLSNIQNQEISEDVYYQVIKQKTAALFEACCAMGALSAGASEEEIEAARLFGQNLGIIFQIRDDIFDYYDSAEIGKPTGNDMAEGKLTLPAIYAVNNTPHPSIKTLARKVKDRTVTADEIAVLVDYTKAHGGIEYAERRMDDFRREALGFIENHVKDEEIRDALSAYLDFVIERRK